MLGWQGPSRRGGTGLGCGVCGVPATRVHPAYCPRPGRTHSIQTRHSVACMQPPLNPDHTSPPTLKPHPPTQPAICPPQPPTPAPFVPHAITEISAASDSSSRQRRHQQQWMTTFPMSRRSASSTRSTKYGRRTRHSSMVRSPATMAALRCCRYAACPRLLCRSQGACPLAQLVGQQERQCPAPDTPTSTQLCCSCSSALLPAGTPTDLVVTHALEWPSLTVQWLPVCAVGDSHALR